MAISNGSRIADDLRVGLGGAPPSVRKQEHARSFCGESNNESSARLAGPAFERLPDEDDSTESVPDARRFATFYAQLAEGLTGSEESANAWYSSRRNFWRRRWKDLRDRSA